jgi:hypothetical protein
MARLPRFDLPYIPQHIVQRGNNRLPCFLDDEAYRAIVGEVLAQSTIDEIRLYLQQQRALGLNAFQNMVEAKTRRFAGVRAAHRPRNLQSDAQK